MLPASPLCDATSQRHAVLKLDFTFTPGVTYQAEFEVPFLREESLMTDREPGETDLESDTDDLISHYLNQGGVGHLELPGVFLKHRRHLDLHIPKPGGGASLWPIH